MFENIPDEMKAYNQWVCWRYDYNEQNRPTKHPISAHDGKFASVNSPLSWADFVLCSTAFSMGACDGIGFVFTASDPFCGIDLDEPKTDQEKAQLNDIYNNVISYAELSPSGNGVHIICRAKLKEGGKRRKPVEMYDNLRFFTMTGNVLRSTINDCQSQVDYLYDMLGRQSSVIVGTYIDKPETRNDESIYILASNAANGAKFLRLWAGDWQTDYGRQTASEGDMALMNILAFYSQNRTQLKRLFRISPAGHRVKDGKVKANREKYLDDMITRAFDRLPAQADLDMLYNQRQEMLARFRTNANVV